MGADSALSLWLVRDRGGRVVALLPLVRIEGGELRLVGFGEADLLGPVCAPTDEQLGLRALREAVEREGAPFTGHDMAAGAKDVLGGTVVHTWPSPLWALGGRSWDELLASRSANFRWQVRRRRARLEERHAVQFSLSEDVDGLIALHEARWDGVSRSFAGARADLHREVARAFAARGDLRLRTLALDGTPVAGLYALRFAGDEWFYQSGRDLRCASLSVGFVLLAEAIRKAADDGVGSYRLLRGGETYKARFSDGDEPVETVAVP